MPLSPPRPEVIPIRGTKSPPSLGPRVLVVARWPVGGIRTHLGYNAPALAKAGYRCTFLVAEDAAGALGSALEGVGGCEIVGVPTERIDRGLWSAVREQLHARSYGLVHAHGMSAAAHATFAGLLSPVPLLVTLHEPLRAAQFAGVKGQCKRWLLGRALARAAALVTVSDDSRTNLLRFFPNLRREEQKVVTLPNGIDVAGQALPPDASVRHSPTRQRGFPASPSLALRAATDCQAGKPDLRAELDLDDAVLIGYLGRFMPEKGFPLLIEAAARLKRFGGTRPFHVVAFGSGDYRREYQRDLDRRGLADHVTLRDFVPDVGPVLRQLDLLVVPSLWEASSLVSMEAMAAGVPVLGSDCPGLREVLRDTPSRTVKAGEAAALETGLREALADLWTDEAANFAEAARARFDVRRSAARLVELYDRVTTGGVSPTRSTGSLACASRAGKAAWSTGETA